MRPRLSPSALLGQGILHLGWGLLGHAGEEETPWECRPVAGVGGGFVCQERLFKPLICPVVVFSLYSVSHQCLVLVSQ